MMKHSSRQLANNFQDLVAKVKNLVVMAPVLGVISRPDDPCITVNFMLQSSVVVLNLNCISFL